MHISLKCYSYILFLAGVNGEETWWCEQVCSWFCCSSIVGTQNSAADTLRPESNKENLLREGWLHCKITLLDGKVIYFISALITHIVVYKYIK